MLHGFAVPTRRSARGSRSSTWMLCIEPWESLTQNFAAPPAAAPSMHAFASSAIHLRARSYSRPSIITWLWAATPPMPSMSTEIHTLLAARFGTAAMVRGLIECCVRDTLVALPPKWRNGRLARFRGVWPKGREGSNPSFGTAEHFHVRDPLLPLASECRPTRVRVDHAEQL